MGSLMETVEQLYQLEAYDACAGIVVRDGVVVEAAPFFIWMVGKTFQEASQWHSITKIVLLSATAKL